MKTDLFFDAMNSVDDDMLEAVDSLRRNRKPAVNRAWIRWASAAACACVVLGGALAASRFGSEDGDGAEVGSDRENYADGATGTMGTAGVTIPKTEISIKPNSSADLPAFFIYDGRMYVQYEWVRDHPELAGEYVGTSTGNIDCFTSKKEYVNFAGSVSGDFYTVTGFDPSFMLCMKYADGSVSVYVNDNGLTLQKGSDLFEDRLHLSGNYSSVEYQTRYDWFHSLGNIKTVPDNSAEVIETFISELNNGTFMYTDDIPLEDGQSDIYDQELYHLFFCMNNGMTVHLRLYDGGYVRYAGLIPVCVKMDEAAFDALVGLLNLSLF